jgi:hypothetical protein
MLSFVPDCCQFLAIGHQKGAFTRIGAIEAENLLVRAGNLRFLGVVVGLSFSQMRMRSRRTTADLSSFDSATSMPPPSRSTVQAKRISWP